MTRALKSLQPPVEQPGTERERVCVTVSHGHMGWREVGGVERTSCACVLRASARPRCLPSSAEKRTTSCRSLSSSAACRTHSSSFSCSASSKLCFSLACVTRREGRQQTQYKDTLASYMCASLACPTVPPLSTGSRCSARSSSPLSCFAARLRYGRGSHCVTHTRQALPAAGERPLQGRRCGQRWCGPVPRARQHAASGQQLPAGGTCVSVTKVNNNAVESHLGLGLRRWPSATGISSLYASKLDVCLQ